MKLLKITFEVLILGFLIFFFALTTEKLRQNKAQIKRSEVGLELLRRNFKSYVEGELGATLLDDSLSYNIMNLVFGSNFQGLTKSIGKYLYVDPNQFFNVDSAFQVPQGYFYSLSLFTGLRLRLIQPQPLKLDGSLIHLGEILNYFEVQKKTFIKLGETSELVLDCGPGSMVDTKEFYKQEKTIETEIKSLEQVISKFKFIRVALLVIMIFIVIVLVNQIFRKKNQVLKQVDKGIEQNIRNKVIALTNSETNQIIAGEDADGNTFVVIGGDPVKDESLVVEYPDGKRQQMHRKNVLNLTTMAPEDLVKDQLFKAGVTIEQDTELAKREMGISDSQKPAPFIPQPGQTANWNGQAVVFTGQTEEDGRIQVKYPDPEDPAFEVTSWISPDELISND